VLLDAIGDGGESPIFGIDVHYAATGRTFDGSEDLVVSLMKFHLGKEVSGGVVWGRLAVEQKS
jgi:hypothetical protein